MKEYFPSQTWGIQKKEEVLDIQKYTDSERQFLSILTNEELPSEELKMFGKSISDIYNLSAEKQKEILKNLEKREKEIYYNSFIQDCVVDCDKNNVTPSQMYNTYKRWHNRNYFDEKIVTLTEFKYNLSNLWKKPVNNMWINVKIK